MPIKPVNTAIKLTVGPLVDWTDGKTLETCVTVCCLLVDLFEETDNGVTKTDITATAACGDNDWAHVGNGVYSLEITAAQNNTTGTMYIVVAKPCTILPARSERYEIVCTANADKFNTILTNSCACIGLDANVFGWRDSTPNTLTSGTVQADVQNWDGTVVGGVAPGGYPYANTLSQRVLQSGSTTTCVVLHACENHPDLTGVVYWQYEGGEADEPRRITAWNNTSKTATLCRALSGSPSACEGYTLILGTPVLTGAISSGAITASTLASCSITAAKVASDVGTEIADSILKRDWNCVTGEADRSALNALRFLRNKFAICGSTITVYQEDDTTTAWTGSITTASREPLSSIDPA